MKARKSFYCASPSLAVILFVLCIPRPLSETALRASPLHQHSLENGARGMRVIQAYGHLPLNFEVNWGQADARVKYLARGHGYALFLTADEAVLALPSSDHIAGMRRPEFAGSELIFSPDGPGALVNLVMGDAAEGFGPQEYGPNAESVAQTPHLVRIKLLGANPSAHIVGLDELPGKSNYFLGKNPALWHTNVPTYARVKYEDVYPGIGLVYYGNRGRLEYDFIVRPGADPRVIRMMVDAQGEGRQPAPLRVDEDGGVVIGTEGGKLRFQKPVVYQPAKNPIPPAVEAGSRHYLDGGFVLSPLRRRRKAESAMYEVRFDVPNYDRSLPLVIDPLLSYSTYLGGSKVDVGFRIAVDSNGSAYIAGATNSPNFPLGSTPIQSIPGQGFCGLKVEPCPDAFVTKLSADGAAIAYSTYLGGSRGDVATGVAVDASGNAYVTGFTSSSDFPTTLGAFQTVGGGQGDAFVTKLNAAGSSLVYSTFLGGSKDEIGMGIAVDSSGSAFVTGGTASVDFPTQTPFQAANGGANACSGSSSMSRGVFCFDVFVTKVNDTGSGLIFSSYLGGSADDVGTAIALDATGDAYLTGVTVSADFPTAGTPVRSANGGGTCKASGAAVSCPDAFVAKVSSAGSTLAYSTYLGGGAVDVGFGIAVDSSGSAYVAGATNSPDFPTTAGAFRTTLGGGTCGSGTKLFVCPDAFVSKLDSAGSSLVYSTTLGGGQIDLGFGIALDAASNAYVVGGTNSSNFPTVNPVQSTFAGGSCSLTRLHAPTHF